MVEHERADDRPGYAATDRQQRDPRDSLFMLARIRPEDGAAFESVRVRNVSSGGLMAQASDAYRVGTRVEIELEGVGLVAGAVAWAEAGRIGIAFDHPVDKSRARKPAAGSFNPDAEAYRTRTEDFRRPPIRTR